MIFMHDTDKHQHGALLLFHFTEKEVEAAKYWGIFIGKHISIPPNTQVMYLVGFKLQTCFASCYLSFKHNTPFYTRRNSKTCSSHGRFLS